MSDWFIKRADGVFARIIVEGDDFLEGDDFWTGLNEQFPMSYNLITEGMVYHNTPYGQIFTTCWNDDELFAWLNDCEGMMEIVPCCGEMKVEIRYGPADGVAVYGNTVHMMYNGEMAICNVKYCPFCGKKIELREVKK